MSGSAWPMIALTFAVLVIGIFVGSDVARIPGLVIVCIAAAIGFYTRLTIIARRRRR